MIPRDHHDPREPAGCPQALVRDLRAQEGTLPEALRRQCVAAGAAMVPALIALLEAGLADDQAEPEGALFHAVDLLGALGDARAVPILLRCLEPDDLVDGLASPAAAALRTLGPAVLEGCLAAYATTTHAAFRDRLAGVLSRCGVHDERLYACLVETLQRTPELGANDLVEYGEARALDVLARPFDTLPLRDEETPLANHVFIELRAAIEELGGQLTAAQHQKFAAADAARRRLVAQLHWAVDPPAAPAWRTPPQATSVAGPRPSRPAGTRKRGRNAPAGMAVARSIKNVISRSHHASAVRARAHGWPLHFGSRPSGHGCSAEGASSWLVSLPLGTPGAEVVTAMYQA